MALLTSSPATVSVTSFPYPLPNSAGQVVFIGTNFPRDVRPPTHSVYNWEYACFGYYGGGAFVQDYSAGGAWAVAGSGGHGAPPNIGALIFDFADATWKRRDNSNGVPWTTGEDYPTSTFVGGEFPGTTCPGPAHQYSLQKGISTAQGGGPRGSYICFAFSAMGDSGNTGAGAHRIDLNTGFWTRASTNSAPPYSVGGQQTSFYDPVSNRYYVPARAANGVSLLPYLDANDWTWKTINHASISTVGYYTASGFIDLNRRLFALWDSNRFIAMDLDNLGAGWTPLNMTGSGPVEYECDWTYYPPDGCFYHLFSTLSSTNILTKLTPPPLGGNKFSGTWVRSTVTLSATLQRPGDWVDPQGGGAKHTNRLIYVPALQRLAWLAGDTTVAIIKPS